MLYDIEDDIQIDINLSADDTSLLRPIGEPVEVGTFLQSDIDNISRWAQKLLVKVNPSKLESLVIYRKRFKSIQPGLFMSNIEIPFVICYEQSGIFLPDDASWDIHISKSIEKAWKRIGIIRHLKTRLDRLSLQILYISFIRPILEYGDVIWDNLSQGRKHQLDKVQI